MTLALLDVLAEALGWLILAWALTAILHLMALAARMLSRA